MIRTLTGVLTRRAFSTIPTPPPVSNLREEYKKLYQICKPEWRKYAYCGAITLLHAATFMYLPQIYTDINHLMELKLDPLTSTELAASYATVIAKWGAIFGGLGGLTYLRRYQFLDVSNRISVRFRTVLYQNVLGGDYYRQRGMTQAWVHHLVTDIKWISEFTGQMVFMGVRGVCFLIGGTACLLYYSPQLSLAAVCIMSIFNWLFRRRNALLKHLKQQENKALISITQFASEKLNSLRLIKISNTEKQEQYQFARVLRRFYNHSKQVSKANGINYGVLEGLGLFSLFGVATTGALLISLRITDFSLIASSTYAIYVAMGFRAVISFNTELVKTMALYANVEQQLGLLHTDPRYSQPFALDHLKQLRKQLKQLEEQRYPIESKGVDISVHNLHFSYRNSGGQKIDHIYQNYNVKIQPGSVVALVGPSGSGKSTLFNLVTKLEERDAGSIELDGVNIDELSFRDIQRMVSYVTQEALLFKGTFRQNLTYGNQHFDCSDERLFECLEITNARQLVEQKGGLDGEIHEKGGNLSGGEKQRLVLARALVKHPRLLLLDEGTSGVDSASERIIIENLGKLRGDMTTILISHKLGPFRSILTSTINLR